MFWIKISLCIVLSSRDTSCKWQRTVNRSFSLLDSVWSLWQRITWDKISYIPVEMQLRIICSGFRLKKPNQPNKNPRNPSLLCSRLVKGYCNSESCAQKYKTAVTEVMMYHTMSGLFLVTVKLDVCFG